MALILTDTNILARRFERASPQNPVASGAMKRLRARGDELVIAPQTLYELWVVLTRPATARGGFGKTPEEAARLLAACAGVCRVLPDSPLILPTWLDLVSRYSVSGVRAHDVRLVAAMKIHGVAQILTFNGRDFQAFAPEGIAVLDPTTI
jgi:predicted nucleic acid-binding protein